MHLVIKGQIHFKGNVPFFIRSCEAENPTSTEGSARFNADVTNLLTGQRENIWITLDELNASKFHGFVLTPASVYSSEFGKEIPTTELVK